MINLKILKNIPDSLLDTRPHELHDILGGPTLICLNENGKPGIFLSTLLHGNEHSGFDTAQILLNEISKNQLHLDRPLYIFIGNTMAAKENLRHLPNQIDFNRVWSGGDCELARIATQVKEFISSKRLLCNIDLHNNTGKNPYYACISHLDDQHLSLAKFFFNEIVYFTDPCEVQSNNFSKFCPSITIEAGNSGDMKGVKYLVSRIKELLKLEELTTNLKKEELDVFHTIGRFIFDQDTLIDFEGNPHTESDVSLRPEVENFNFRPLPPGTKLGFIKNQSKMWIEGHPLENAFDEFIEVVNGELIVKKQFIPSMLTKDMKVLKSDCFGYLMESVTL